MVLMLVPDLLGQVAEAHGDANDDDHEEDGQWNVDQVEKSG